jgi:hypothetical protein
MKSASIPWPYRASVVARLVAAVGGGYLLGSAVAALVAVQGMHLGLPRSEAVLWGTMLGFALHAASAMGCFHCRRAWQAWAGTAGPAALLGAVAMLPRWVAG